MKTRWLGDERLRAIATAYGTPVYVYSAELVRARARELAAFDRIRYAQKANSNLAILRLMRSLGVGVDAVSAGEVERALAVGYAPEEVVFTADLFDRATLELVLARGVAVNLGSPDMIAQYGERRPGAEITLRVNPGFGHGHDQRVNTGGEASKHGIWHAGLADALALARRHRLRIGGLHVHIGSGADFEHLARVAEAIERIALEVGGEVHTVSAGGGLPTPYKPSERRLDVARYCELWMATRERLRRALGNELRLEVEPGRYLVAEAGLLLAEVRGRKRSGQYDYVMVDAGFHNLIRPAMYGAYHHVSIVGRDAEPSAPRVVAGPLCESADVFTQGKGGALDPRALPDARIGDLVCLHDCGAYAASMASNYNSQPLAPEVLVDGESTQLVRRRQTIAELLALEQKLPGAR